jgi:photosystem II stability/assembly factor-like uncharacterized protein
MTTASSKYGLTFMLTLTSLNFVSLASSRHRQEIVPLRPPLLRSVRFADNIHGWIAGYNGVYYTSDGGNSWRRLRGELGALSRFPANAATDVGRLVWADKNQALLRNETGLTHVTIHPFSWQETTINPDVLNQISSIDFIDRRHGFASGTLSHQVFLTSDGGLNWESFETPAHDILPGLFVVSASEVWIVGVEGIVLHTTDSGRTWGHMILTSSNSEAVTGLRSIYFIDRMNGWICGPSAEIFHTVNGGREWLREKTPFAEKLPFAFNAISFASDRDGWVVGEYCADYVDQRFQGIVLHTTDGGSHWDWQPINLIGSLLDIQALPNGTGWAVAREGAVIRTIDHGRRWESAQFRRDAERIVFTPKRHLAKQ